MMWKRSAIARCVLGLAICFAASACVSTKTLETTNAFEKVDGPSRILLLEPDVSIRFIKASEVREVRADWTEQAETNLLNELRSEMKTRDIDIEEFEMSSATDREIQLVKLHEAVGNTIFTHRYAYLPLPSKDDKFDWSLGPGVREFAENHDADYALFLFARGDYASSGKVMANILMTAAGFGTGSTGGQIAFASLVDLRSGDIVWFNVTQTGAGTDMREETGAAHLIDNLLRDIPL